MEQMSSSEPEPQQSIAPDEKNEKIDEGAETQPKPVTGVPLIEKAKKQTEQEAETEQDEKQNENADQKVKLHPRIRERHPSSLSGKEFSEAYENCKNPQEKQELILRQAALGNVPESYRAFEPVTIKSGAQTLTINVAKRRFVFGTDEDAFEVPLDGPTSMAIAQMYDCTIPTYWMAKRIEEEAKERGVILPFTGQHEFATHDDQKMMSPEYTKLHNEANKKKAENYPGAFKKLTVGYYKFVIHPIPGVTRSGGLEIYGGIDSSDNRIQPPSGGIHAETYADYSHGTQLVSQKAILNGKLVDLEDVLRDPEIAKAFGFTPTDITSSYTPTSWMEKHIQSAKSGAPAPVPVPSMPTEPEQPDQPEEPTAPLSEQTNSTSIPAAVPVYEPPPSYNHNGGHNNSAPSTQPASYTPPPEQAPPPPVQKVETPAAPPENIEIPTQEKIVMLGDSHTGGNTLAFRQKFPGATVESLYKDGRHTSQMLSELKANQERIAGGTLVICGGANDVYSNYSAQDTIENLKEMYSIARKNNMKIIALTIPPVGDNPVEAERIESAIEKAKTINTWIREQARVENGPIDELIDLDKIFEDPNNPGHIAPESKGITIHLNREASEKAAQYIGAAVAATHRPSEQQPQPEEAESQPASPQPTPQESAEESEQAEKPGVSITTIHKGSPLPKPTTNAEYHSQSKFWRSQVSSEYKAMHGRVRRDLEKIAVQILRSPEPLGSQVLIELDNGESYIAVIEYHPNRGKPGWHRGVGLLKKRTT